MSKIDGACLNKTKSELLRNSQKVLSRRGHYLRWLETVYSMFQDLDFNGSMGHYSHSISVDANFMVLKYCPVIPENVAVNFVKKIGYHSNNANAENTLNLNRHFLLSNYYVMQNFAPLRSGFRVTLHFRKFKVAVNLLSRTFLDFAKHYTYHAYYNSIIKNRSQ